MKSNINLESLESERKINKAILFYKIQNNLVDVTLYLCQAAHFPGKFTLIHCRTTAIRDPLYHTASLWGTHYQWHQPPQSHLKPSRPVHQVSWYIYIRPEHNFSSQPTAQQLSWLCTLHSTTHTLWRWRADLTTHPDVYDGRRTWTYTCTSGL